MDAMADRDQGGVEEIVSLPSRNVQYYPCYLWTDPQSVWVLRGAGLGRYVVAGSGSGGH
jgi:hypothetical protein